MTESPDEQMQRVASSRHETESSRLAAIRGLGELQSPAALETLLEVGSRDEEPEAILSAVGSALVSLQANGVTVSEWDLRDLARPAADSFFA